MRFFLYYKHKKSQNRKKRSYNLCDLSRWYIILYSTSWRILEKMAVRSINYFDQKHVAFTKNSVVSLNWNYYGRVNARIGRFAWNEREKARNYTFFIKFNSDDYISHSNSGSYLAGKKHIYISISLYFFIEDNIIKRYRETFKKNFPSEVYSLCSMIRHYNMRDSDLRFCAKQWIYWFYNDVCLYFFLCVSIITF